MKIRIFLLGILFLFVCGPVAQAQEYGKIRALKQRAAFVTARRMILPPVY